MVLGLSKSRLGPAPPILKLAHLSRCSGAKRRQRLFSLLRVRTAANWRIWGEKNHRHQDDEQIKTAGGGGWSGTRDTLRNFRISARRDR